MSTDGQGIKWRRNIAENFNRLSRAHERYRQTTDDTFAKNGNYRHSVEGSFGNEFSSSLIVVELWRPEVVRSFVRSLRAGVQPTLNPSAETVSRSNVLAQRERRGISWCVRVCA